MGSHPPTIKMIRTLVVLALTVFCVVLLQPLQELLLLGPSPMQDGLQLMLTGLCPMLDGLQPMLSGLFPMLDGLLLMLEIKKICDVREVKKLSRNISKCEYQKK